MSASNQRPSPAETLTPNGSHAETRYRPTAVATLLGAISLLGLTVPSLSGADMIAKLSDSIYINVGGGIARTQGTEYTFGDYELLQVLWDRVDPPVNAAFGPYIYKVRSKESAPIFSVNLGANLTNWLAIEARYQKSGTLKTDTLYSPSLPMAYEFAPFNDITHEEYSYEAAGIGVLGTLPLTESLGLRLGAFVDRTFVRYDQTRGYLFPTENTKSANSTLTNATVTAELSYRATDHARVGLRWEHPILSSSGFTLGSRYPNLRIDTLTANVGWTF